MSLRVALALTFYAWLLSVAAEPTRRSSGRRERPQYNNHGNISELLDNLLRGYDNSVRPNFGGPPAIVEVDIMVRSMGPISEIDMTYSMDCYFRQSWVDRRLAFQSGKETLALSISMLAKIWKPDTYFYNGKQSYLHTITSPNKFVRLYQDGRVLYSSRLTIKAACPMNLEDFPMDTQRCPLKFGSYGYTTRDVIYKWNEQRQVAIAHDMTLAAFDLVHAANATGSIFLQNSLVAEYSMLIVSFHLKRHMGNFLIQVYGPCVLLVVLSWVSFWLNREATADRVSLGIMTVLTMTFLGLEARTDLPKVPYPTALDFFVFLSFCFIFATIIQFAVVHYFTKYGSGECYFGSDLDDDDADLDDHEHHGVRHHHHHQDSSDEDDNSEVVLDCGPASEGPIAATCSYHHHQQQHQQRHHYHQQQQQQRRRVSRVRRQRRKMPRYNSVSKIDRASRLVFPLFFLAINLFYWFGYLSRSKRIDYFN
ncbi:gamma-aminobutyric acid receptor alpha-like [Copidosoma floridanum]|uniref:gamma-aminobutyric acid receptor alpha-like n=1 Tax=Copidosoma floridanum TaxID=29053 RepID=UPI0006C992CA|nr:gamma-aminobutyric acid receptor alpha-like [Copidosoma floridanum]XP_014208926.1 gamma-aminobutyric acid receptor alpha-like [Copidosoma floridanum]XP_014208927.1 gamma-aminobutyric acid receptor alpha-like [Copidosoma floridanum]